MEFFIVWIISAVGGLLLDGVRGLAWGFFLGPIGLVVAAISKPKKVEELETKRAIQREAETKRCPYCDELIRAKAIVCKHCKKDLTEDPETLDK
ncbi:MAG: zinc ribbon domain-containing protein [Gracilimonas sp.]|uniref:zinc ribbon domain-containing protein n=1 Tax=Gracilimonas sp. TaxID=1974203 RepID=UPI001989E5A9|nr:zinc ribbon domain-containing protein [Gracilimonas sp.]MBD3616647.1 zinc ribbon domain-containing protein [Gracilimonas sp.]